MIAPAVARIPGRPRSSRADRAILDTTTRLLVEQGYDAMSIEGVAAAAGVGKTTIYRRYRSKRELVVAALRSVAAGFEPPPDSGDTRADLAAFLRDAFRVFDPAGGVGFPMLGTLLVHEREDPELLALFREHILRPRMALAVAILRRGVERGVLRPDTPCEAVIQVIAGSLFARHVAGGALDEAWLDTVLGLLWPGIVAAPDRSRSDG